MSRPSANEHWWERYVPSVMAKYVPRGATLPLDIALVVGYLVVADIVLSTLPVGAVAVRALVGVPLLFFVPGYVLVAALFPAQKPRIDLAEADDTAVDRPDPERRHLDWRERLALSFGSSVAVLPLFGLLLSVVGVGYSTLTIVATISLVTALGLVPAVVYRLRTPPAERLELPTDRWSAVIEGGVVERDDSIAAVNVLVAALVVVSLAGVGYAVVTPNNAESFTSVSLVTANEDGELVAAGYPATIDEGGEELTLRLENEEGTTTDYTVVAQLQQVETAGATTTVLRREEVARMDARLAPGESWTSQHTVTPAMAGEDLRLIYYVYEGEPPAQHSTETAYRHVNVWVDVPESAAE